MSESDEQFSSSESESSETSITSSDEDDISIARDWCRLNANNSYAEKYLKANHLTPRSRSVQWHPTNDKEIRLCSHDPTRGCAETRRTSRGLKGPY